MVRSYLAFENIVDSFLEYPLLDLKLCMSIVKIVVVLIFHIIFPDPQYWKHNGGINFIFNSLIPFHFSGTLIKFPNS